MDENADGFLSPHSLCYRVLDVLYLMVFMIMYMLFMLLKHLGFSILLWMHYDSYSLNFSFLCVMCFNGSVVALFGHPLLVWCLQVVYCISHVDLYWIEQCIFICWCGYIYAGYLAFWYNVLSEYSISMHGKVQANPFFVY